MVRRTHGTGETAADATAEAPKFEKADLSPGSNQMTYADETLLRFCERFERLSEEIKELSNDRKEVMSEAKGSGFDTKILRETLRRRAMGRDERMEHDAILDMYETALARAEKAAFDKSKDDGE